MFEETLSWVDNELKQNRNDIIHDFLSYLAEQMIEMNKKKQKEIKDFLEWLERELGVKIDDLSNKSSFKEYYKLNFNEFLDLLKKNQKKITKIYFGNRDTQENFKKEFENSISKLVPLIDKIEKTDNLIDNIVYKLYGLEKEEVGIVENSMKKEERGMEKGDENGEKWTEKYRSMR